MGVGAALHPKCGAVVTSLGRRPAEGVGDEGCYRAVDRPNLDVTNE